MFLFSNHKRKSLFTPWKLGSIKKPKYLLCGWSVIHICFNIFPLSWVHKVTTRTKSFVSVILNADTWLRTRAIFDQVNIRLIWQWINSISSVLRKLPIHFNGTIISTTFVLLSPILPVICCLKLQQNTVIVIRREINDIFILSKVASSL